ncbi:HIT family protein [Rhizobium rhizogenes]|uniref:HIT family protein n=1 Tax=Rhizobium rhizogenes TaxID=359 RepID=UPI00226F44CB|nr:HIT family protein [Rhizobium rhizogenes]
MENGSHFHITETDGWRVDHRANSTLPGYLIISSKSFVTDLSDLPESTLCELGPLLASSQDALKRRLDAQRVYIGRYGHVAARTLHFHVIPIYDWVEELFWQDSRYRVLEGFAEGEGETPVDGAELTLFVWREFCERAEPPPIRGPSVPEAIALLRDALPHRRAGTS